MFNIKSKKSFTLIELLVVIAIIGILAAMILVAVRGSRLKAQDAAAKGNLSQVKSALMRYYQDNEKYISYADDGSGFPDMCANSSGSTNCKVSGMFSTAKGGTNPDSGAALLDNYMNQNPDKNNEYFYAVSEEGMWTTNPTPQNFVVRWFLKNQSESFTSGITCGTPGGGSGVCSSAGQKVFQVTND
ncbi:MAG: type II secretion system protein [Candidatus Berkelbacteria bacterium]|nr:type II secretion system protein [Candidatus Berkelbacteria bacterium]